MAAERMVYSQLSCEAAGKTCGTHHATNRSLAEAIAPCHSSLGLARLQPLQRFLALIRHQLFGLPMLAPRARLAAIPVLCLALLLAP